MDTQPSTPSRCSRTSNRTRRGGSAAVMRFTRWPPSYVQRTIAPTRVFSPSVTKSDYDRDQERVERGPEMIATLEAWRRVVGGPIEVRRLSPVPTRGPGAPTP